MTPPLSALRRLRPTPLEGSVYVGRFGSHSRLGSFPPSPLRGGPGWGFCRYSMLTCLWGLLIGPNPHPHSLPSRGREAIEQSAMQDEMAETLPTPPARPGPPRRVRSSRG